MGRSRKVVRLPSDSINKVSVAEAADGSPPKFSPSSRW